MSPPPSKRIRVLFFSDTHLGFDHPLKPRVVRRRRGEDFFTNCKRVLQAAVDQQADLAIHGGDLFFRARIPAPIVDRVYALLLEFVAQGIPLILVPGNHEFSRFPELYRLDHPLLSVFARPRTFIREIRGVTVAVSGFPYERKDIKHKFTGLVAECRPPGKAHIRLLCIHHAVEGCRVRHYTFRKGDDVIRSRDIPGGFQAVLSGHIHRAQILPNSPPDSPVPVIYSGSVERTSSAERDETKGCYFLDFVPGENQDWQLTEPRFMPLPTRPMLDVPLNLADLTPENVRANLQMQLRSVDTNAIVRLTCDKSPEDWLIRRLTAEFLRELTPDSMNVSLHSRFFRRDQNYIRKAEKARPGQMRLEVF